MKKLGVLVCSLALVFSVLSQPSLIKCVKAADGVTVYYRTHIQTYGWEGKHTKLETWKADGVMSGTSGQAKRLEAIEIDVAGNVDLGIQYTTHCQTYGWLPWSADGEMNGTEGEAKRLEAVKIQLTGADAGKYDVYYRVHAQTYGWLGWAKNGQAAGTAGLAKRLEGIQIVVVPAGQTVPNECEGIKSTNAKAYISKTGASDESVSGAGTSNVLYRTHMQTFGWQGWKNNGAVSGTSGLAKRLEGINIKLTNQQYDGEIKYRTHVQGYGWQVWKANGVMSGTSGEAKRLESIQIYLTEDMAKHYDLYYRVHAQSYGWLGWVKNGEPSGTAGFGKRLEAIQITLVDKGQGAPGNVGGIVSKSSKGFVYKDASQIPDNPYVEPSDYNQGGSSGGVVQPSDYTEYVIDTDVTDYTYEITPLYAPFNNMFFVKTDNPNPINVRFIDKESKYYNEERSSDESKMCVLKPVSKRFVDVAYEDKETGRVNGGYLFETSGYGTDGGDLVLQQIGVKIYVYNETGEKTVMVGGSKDTSVTVKCEEVIPVDYYLVENYTDPSKDLWENLNSVQEVLGILAVADDGISIYPKTLRDISKPTADGKSYPFLATGLYTEMTLNEHYDFCADSEESSLLYYSYPYVLSSRSFPNMMASVATILEPDCTLESVASRHELVKVVYNGEYGNYGGTGEGGSNPIFTHHIELLYPFDGSSNDYLTKSLEERYAKMLEIDAKADEELSMYQAMISRSKLLSTIKSEANGAGGAWFRVATPAYYGTTYTYLYTLNVDSACWLQYAEDVWVDGRYIDEKNNLVLGATFEEHPNATIIVRDMTYVNVDGETVTQDVAFEYESEYDAWYGYEQYFKNEGFSDSDMVNMPDEMVLTRDEVLAMKVDKNSGNLPEKGYIYDGTVKPGTAFTN